MKNIEQKILYTYTAGETSLRDVAALCETDHHRVKRVLVKNNIAIVKAKGKPLSEDHKKKLVEANKGRPCWMRGKNATRCMLLKNMAAHLRFDVTFEWLDQFSDVEKLKCLNDCITNRGGRFEVTNEWYRSYILKFYHCVQFNKIYDLWVINNKEAYRKPSIDHVIPVSKGGTNALENLSFLTWLENRSKTNIYQDDWDNIKNNLNEYFV